MMNMLLTNVLLVMYNRSYDRNQKTSQGTDTTRSRAYGAGLQSVNASQGHLPQVRHFKSNSVSDYQSLTTTKQ